MAAVKHASNLGSDQMADLSHEASGPLAGTRIVDLTTILLGPVATQMLGEPLATRTTAEWIEAFDAANIPPVPIDHPDDLVADPHFAATGFWRTIEHSRARHTALSRCTGAVLEDCRRHRGEAFADDGGENARSPAMCMRNEAFSSTVAPCSSNRLCSGPDLGVDDFLAAG